jgi:hypothetical protein
MKDELVVFCLFEVSSVLFILFLELFRLGSRLAGIFWDPFKMCKDLTEVVASVRGGSGSDKDPGRDGCLARDESTILALVLYSFSWTKALRRR